MVSECASRFVDLAATSEGQKPRLVVLGSGWAGCRVLRDININAFDVVCISPRNHMVFTPLLASTCVGTLEFRSICQSVRSISPKSTYIQAICTNIDPVNHKVTCEPADLTCEKYEFNVAYDKLVIASGADAQTFGIKGVADYATFLREVPHAMEIRKKLLTNLMLADLPGVSVEEKKRLLHVVIVGGGPIGVEFSGELIDFIRSDIRDKYAHLQEHVSVTIIEAMEILSMFEANLRDYAKNHLINSGVNLIKGAAKEVFPDKVVLRDESSVSYGVLVWATGVTPSTFVRKLELKKSPRGRIGVDLNLRLPNFSDVYAIGDCAAFVEETGKMALPELAQVAEKQGKYVAESLNKIAKAGGGRANAVCNIKIESFEYKSAGIMVSLGQTKAMADLKASPFPAKGTWTGFSSWLLWRTAYLTKVMSWRNKFNVAVNWGTTFLFGRDISKF